MQKRMLAVFVLMTMVSVCNASEMLSRIAAMLASAPNATRQIDPADDPKPAELKRRGIDRQFRVEIESPKASLLVWVLDPRDEVGNIVTPEATVFMLHGIMASKSQMLSPARVLLKEKCRVILVDSRGHGRSTGQYLTYGVQESKDLSKILDVLTAKGLIKGNVGVFGRSYGAATAIQWAGREPPRAGGGHLRSFQFAAKSRDELCSEIPALFQVVSDGIKRPVAYFRSCQAGRL